MGKILKYLVLIVLLIFTQPTIAFYEADNSASINNSDKYLSISDKERYVQRATIKAVLDSYNSPLASQVDGFMNACMTYDIDCYLLPSIAGLESTFGKFTYPNSHNPFGWGGGLIMFESWEDGFMAVAKGLRNNYIDKGRDTIDKIAPIYAESPTWATRVSYFHNKFKEAESEKALIDVELAKTLR